MKTVTGVFPPESMPNVVNQLTRNGFSKEALSTISSIKNMPDYLEGEVEEEATSGAAVGAVIGGGIGAASSAAAVAIPGFEASYAAGFIATAAGAALGTYLGSIYSVRAESQTELNIHEAIAEGKTLLIVNIEANGEAETAVSILKAHGGDSVEVHEVSPTS